MVQRGLFVGEGGTAGSGGSAAYQAAAEVGRRRERHRGRRRLRPGGGRLDPAELRTTWLGNKAVYRTRMAVDDGGELLVLAPGVSRFGEDPLLDGLIRRHGYRGTPATLEALAADPELAANLGAAAHLIHGSAKGRFRITYCTDPAAGGLTPRRSRASATSGVACPTCWPSSGSTRTRRAGCAWTATAGRMTSSPTRRSACGPWPGRASPARSRGSRKRQKPAPPDFGAVVGAGVVAPDGVVVTAGPVLLGCRPSRTPPRRRRGSRRTRSGQGVARVASHEWLAPFVSSSLQDHLSLVLRAWLLAGLLDRCCVSRKRRSMRASMLNRPAPKTTMTSASVASAG